MMVTVTVTVTVTGGDGEGDGNAGTSKIDMAGGILFGGKER
jgi:hypothetical protein